MGRTLGELAIAFNLAASTQAAIEAVSLDGKVGKVAAGTVLYSRGFDVGTL